MLTDPFYSFEPAYSDSSTGVVELGSRDTVGLLLGMKGVLQDAGWTVSEILPSTAEQSRLKWNFSTVTPPDGTVVKVPLDEGCDDPIHPMREATMDGMSYVSYDAYRYTPPLCPNRIYYEAKETTLETADRLMDTMMAAGIFIAGIGETDTEYIFNFTSTQPAFEHDLHTFRVGGTGNQSLIGGYYMLTSPPMYNGGRLSLKLQTQYVGFGGGFIIVGQGPVTPYLTLTSSAGGEYKQPFFASEGVRYHMHANAHQFAIWPAAGDGRGASSLFASMPVVDEGHPTGENPVIVVGSHQDNFSDYQQLTTRLHWEAAYGTGYSDYFDVVGWGTHQESTGFWKNPTFLWRGFRGQPLVSETGMPLAEAPYVLLSADPNHQEGSRIGGRPWDMLLLSGYGGEADSMIQHQGHKWRLFAASPRPDYPADLTGTLWLLDDQAEE